MKFLDNLIARIRAMASYRWERITTNMPLRMKVGRFGIWLIEIGRALQVRYANWNGEFRLEREFRIYDPNFCVLHVSDRVTQKSIITLDSYSAQPQERTPMTESLFAIKGVCAVALRPYQIEIRKGRVFSWGELLPSIEKVILEHLAAK